jgi:hypothetical protein
LPDLHSRSKRSLDLELQRILVETMAKTLPHHLSGGIKDGEVRVPLPDAFFFPPEQYDVNQQHPEQSRAD